MSIGWSERAVVPNGFGVDSHRLTIATSRLLAMERVGQKSCRHCLINVSVHSAHTETAWESNGVVMTPGILRLFADYCPSQVLGPEEEIFKRMRARTMSKKKEKRKAVQQRCKQPAANQSRSEVALSKAPT